MDDSSVFFEDQRSEIGSAESGGGKRPRSTGVFANYFRFQFILTVLLKDSNLTIFKLENTYKPELNPCFIPKSF